MSILDWELVAHDQEKIIESLRQQLAEAQKDAERMYFGLENCRLLAARHRKEDWALLILGFCAEAGVAGSVYCSLV